MNKIDEELPLEVLKLLAEACGFQLFRCTTVGIDEWTLWRGHGVSHVQHVGTRKAICAFLAGYSDMRLLTAQILNELEAAHRSVIAAMRVRLGGGHG